MKLKRHVLALAAASAMILMTSCGSPDLIPAASEVTVKFSWWCKDIRNNFTAEAVDQFVRMNPNIDVFTDFGEFDSYQNHIFVSYAAGSESDVMQINYDWLYRFEESGEGFYDLDELSEHIDLSTFSENQLSYGKVGDKLVGIPVALNAETFFYNKSIYDEYELSLPEKWSDIFRAASVMSKDGIYPIEMDKTAAWLSCIAYREQHTGRLCFDQSGALRFDQNDFKEMLTFYKSLIDGKVMKHYSERKKDDLFDGVSAGVLCWISESDSLCQPLINRGREIVIGNYLRDTGTIISGWYAKPTALYSIKKNTEYPTESAKLVNFLVNSQEMAQLQGTDLGIPLSRAMLEVLEADKALTGIQFEANNKLSRSKELNRISPSHENAELIEAFDRAVSAMLYDGREPDELARELYAKATESVKIKK